MPRDGSGTYSLPGGINPVISGTTIDTVWANPTLDDVASALTDSLSRTGAGGMLVPFLNADGAIGSPGIAWVNEPTMGLYREAAAEMRVSLLGVDRTRWVDNVDPFGVWIVSDASWRPVLNTFNPYTIIGDWTWEGRLVTDNSTTARAGFNITLGTEPTSPVDGDMWLESDNIYARVAGVTRSMIGAENLPISFVTSSILRGDGAGGWVEEFDLLINSDGDLSTEGTIELSDGVNQMIFENTGPDVFVTGTGGFGDLQFNVPVKMGDTFYLGDRTNAGADISGWSQLWSQNDSPNRIMFTSDIGDDHVIAISGGRVSSNVTVNSGFNFNTSNNRADNWIGVYNDSGNDTITLEDSSSVVNWPLYTTVNIIHPGSGDLSVNEGSGTTLFHSLCVDIGNSTVSEGVVSIFRFNSTGYVIWGSGIT